MKRWVAVLLSAGLIGSGQVYAGRPRRGILLLAAGFALAIASPFTGIIGLAAIPILYLFNVVEVLVVPLRPPPRQLALYLAALIGVSFFGGVLLHVRWVESFKNISGGMLPTIGEGDHFLAFKGAGRPERGDVIVFRFPPDPEKDFVKRVVAVEGDTIAVRQGILILNGKPVPRRHLSDAAAHSETDPRGNGWIQRSAARDEETLGGHTYVTFHDPRPIEDTGGYRGDFPDDARPYVVPKDSVFVLGDNRDNSHDSRYWGPVPLENVKGKVLYFWWASGPEGVRWDRIGHTVE